MANLAEVDAKVGALVHAATKLKRTQATMNGDLKDIRAALHEMNHRSHTPQDSMS